MASKTSKKPVAKATKKAAPKATKAPVKATKTKKVVAKPETQKVVKEEIKKPEIKAEINVANSGRAEVIAARGRAKDSSIIEGILIGLGILLIGLCGGGLFLTKFLSTGDTPIKIATPVFGGVGLIFIIISIVCIIEGHRNNRNKNDCIVYYDASKTVVLNGYRGKAINIKANQLVKASTVCRMLIATYKKPNGKNKRINLGWSSDTRRVKQCVAELSRQ